MENKTITSITKVVKVSNMVDSIDKNDVTKLSKGNRLTYEKRKRFLRALEDTSQKLLKLISKLRQEFSEWDRE